MRTSRKLAWTAAIALATGSPALAQQATTGTGGGNVGSAATQTTAGAGQTQGASSLGSSSIGSSNVAGGNTNSQGNGTGFQLASTLQAPSKSSGSNTNSVIKDPIFGKTYGSVYYQASTPSNVPNGLPGGFGSPIYQSTGTTGAGGRGNAAGGQGARGGTGSVIIDQGGILVPLPRQIAYSSQIQFKMPAGNLLPQLQSDLRGSIDRVPSTMLANPSAVKVEVDGRSVVLRGTVRDEEESHLVEGLVRLTPGVAGIKNELTYTK